MAFFLGFWKGFSVDWDAARGHLRTLFEVTTDAPNMFAVRAKMTVEDCELTQEVGMAVAEAHGRKWLALIAPVCSTDQIDPLTAIRYQDRLPFGALVVRGNSYLFRHGVPFDMLVPGSLQWMVAITAHEATRLRVNLRLPHEPAAFGHYAE